MYMHTHVCVGVCVYVYPPIKNKSLMVPRYMFMETIKN